ncbi:hypothetical protein SAMN05421687_1203 [Salimicrobium flavidum]|uniref:Uncharacterized protein n=1 Tax=Salimicrobium flavidum TaxID=570947 RepID=A0A1N7KVC1_9BACI|nr:hypothetical protein SAMN05421687_1203 [Salimicrobium flavidum]
MTNYIHKLRVYFAKIDFRTLQSEFHRIAMGTLEATLHLTWSLYENESKAGNPAITRDLA